MRLQHQQQCITLGAFPNAFQAATAITALGKIELRLIQHHSI
ncbi:Uncharacterised protein [Vibrio cholerae]|nr:Uncharacterised protein [Vibrio cholerae]